MTQETMTIHHFDLFDVDPQYIVDTVRNIETGALDVYEIEHELWEPVRDCLDCIERCDYNFQTTYALGWLNGRLGAL